MSQMNRRFKLTCHPIWVNHCTSNPTQSSRWDIEWFSIDYLGLIRLYVCIGCLYELYLYSITPGSQSSSTLGFSYSLPLGSLCYAFSASSVTTPCLFREFWAFQTYCCLIIWRHLSSTACTMGLLSDRNHSAFLAIDGNMIYKNEVLIQVRMHQCTRILYSR
jgi:hypothetical protein